MMGRRIVHCPHCDAPGSLEDTDSGAKECRACGVIIRNGRRDDNLDRHAIIAARKKGGQLWMSRPALEMGEHTELVKFILIDYARRVDKYEPEHAPTDQQIEVRMCSIDRSIAALRRAPRRTAARYEGVRIGDGTTTEA